jgi:hypothetical protein
MIRVFCLLVAAAFADEPPATLMARQHCQKATAFFTLGEWKDAAVEYKEAYKALREPVFLYNMAQAYRLGGEVAKANASYNAYAQIMKTAPSPGPDDTPGPAWSDGSDHLGSMTDLIKKHRELFRFCYEAWSRKHPNVNARLKLVLTLAPDGALQSSEARLEELQAPELERCIVAMSRMLTYPASANGKLTRFTYPFEFNYRR